MTTFVVVHGAGGSAWEWHLVAAELASRGHRAITVDLPCEDPAAGLAEYAAAVVGAVRAAPPVPATDGVVVVAHSLGGFTAPLVCETLAADGLVLVAALVPRPGETAGEWWETSGYEAAARERARREGVDARMDDDDALVATFMHDVAPPLAAEALRRGRDQAARPMSDPWPPAAWPDVPTAYLVLEDDRFFPPDFLRRMARERLGLEPDAMPGSHAAYLSRPGELADRLVGYARAFGSPGRRGTGARPAGHAGAAGPPVR
ncbi:alpha/beta hydrolase [Georgenia sp. AZ-5]|uniref:alpha/beta hydrolase n=1 Tax=Georgenia sp. AZ-5 TaxID=3367526 RepID=UPI0037545FF9